jgi:hypothetical protein
MPFLPIIAAIAGLAGTGVGVGLDIADASGNKTPATPATPATPTSTGPTQQQLSQLKSAISAQAPNVIGETSGLANPEYVAQMSQLLAGTSNSPGSTGQAQSVIQSLFGGAPQGPTPAQNQPFQATGTGTQTGPPSVGAGAGLSDFVNQFMFNGG